MAYFQARKINYSFLAKILMVGLVLVAFIPTAKAETLQSVTFRVPLDVSHIHKDIKYLAPMCRIFTGDVASNANELGSVRPNIAVPASRAVSQKITMTVTKANLFPGKNLDDATLYSCTLYVKKSARGPLLSYALSHPDLAVRALDTAPRNVVTGAVKKGRSKAILINTAQLSAKGTQGIISKPLAGIPTTRAAEVDVQRIEGVSRSNTPPDERPVNSDMGRDNERGIGRGRAQAITSPVGVAVDTRPPGPEPMVTNWTPLNAARPGQTLVIEGRNFNPSAFVVQLQGDNDNSINLKIKNATASRIEVEITNFDYTGDEGARLVAFHRGGRQRILDDDYKILEESVVFRGGSEWSLSTYPLNYVQFGSDVTLTLNRFESATSGTGVLQEENVSMAKQVGVRYEPCQKRGVPEEGLRQIIELEHDVQNLENDVTWRKLSDGRVEINGRASFGLFSVRGRVLNNRLILNYVGPVPHVNAAEYTRFIANTPPEECIIGEVPEGQQSSNHFDSHLDGVDLRVGWNLQRITP